MRIYVERWRPRPAWLELDAEQRATFVEAVGPDLPEDLDRGAELVAPGPADPGTARTRPGRSGHRRTGESQHPAAWRFPDPDLVRLFERPIEEAGWYEYSDQVKLGGETVDLDVVFEHLAAA